MLTDFEVKRIDLWSLFKLAFIINAVIGLIIGFFYALMFMAIGGINSAMFADEFQKIGVFGGLFGLIMIPFFSFINAIFGSVIATIAGWVYNLIAGMAGGLRFQANQVVETAAIPQAGMVQRGGAAGGENPNQPIERGDDIAGTEGAGPDEAMHQGRPVFKPEMENPDDLR
jgi:hypothetical protein